jgi:hypothetical protein
MKRGGALEVFKKTFLALIILALLIGGGLFYWYEYRPSIVRERCSIEAEKRADKDAFVYEIIYRHCLRKNGIEYTEQKE